MKISQNPKTKQNKTKPYQIKTLYIIYLKNTLTKQNPISIIYNMKISNTVLYNAVISNIVIINALIFLLFHPGLGLITPGRLLI